MKNFIINTLLFSFCALWGCSADGDGVADIADADGDYIRFGAQVVEPVTRAQPSGIIGFAQLAASGFGVFGYGPSTGDYTTSLQPQLFDETTTNTRVQYHATASTDMSTVLAVPGSWSYAWKPGKTEEDVSLLKTWPKSTDAAQKLHFFAYAPYVASGDLATGTDPGITSVSGVSGMAAGDPQIGYSVSTVPSTSVDLLWGVQSETGLPWKNVTRAKKSASAVLFTMRHALCAVSYQAQVMVNKDNELTDLGDVSSTAAIGTDCRVTICSVTLKPKTNHLYETGTLNLNNTTKNTPRWTSLTRSSATELVLSGDEIDSNVKDPNPTSDSYTTFMATTSGNGYIPGVTESANTQRVIANDNVYMLLPDDVAQTYELEVPYYVTYKKTEGNYSRIKYVGKVTIPDLKLKAGTLYRFNMVFGLTTFKLTVTAEDWTETPISVTTVVETSTSASSSLSRRAASAE